MGDDDLRGRFRRDFTREPIKPLNPERIAPHPTVPVAPKPSPAPVQPQTPPVAQDTSSAQQPEQTQPIVQAQSPLPEIKELEEKPKRKKKKKRLNKKKLLSLVLIVIALLAAAAGIYDYKYLKPSVPASIKTQAEIPIIYPTKLPAGFVLNKSSYNVSNGNVIASYAVNSSGDKIIFTVQPRPNNFDFDKFYSQSLTNSTKFTTTFGEAAIGTANGQLLGSMASDKSWVLVSSSSKNVTSDMIRLCLEHMAITN